MVGRALGWVVEGEKVHGRGRFAGPQGLWGPWEEWRFAKCQDTDRVRQDVICQVRKGGLYSLITLTIVPWVLNLCNTLDTLFT